MFLIPEGILENLTCDNCKKYLSVSPVKVYANKHIHCGRCCEENDGGVVSLYGNIVQRGLFKCINRYDGCNQLLSYSEVSTHENKCKSELYCCPNCSSVSKMPSLHLINHFKEHHKENVLRSHNVSIHVAKLNVDNKKYLYVKDNLLFIVGVSLSNSHIIELNTFLISKSKLSTDITQRFILSFSAEASSDRYITEKRPCCIYEGKYDHDGFRIELKNNKCSLNVEIDLDTRRAQKLFLIPSTISRSIPESEERIHNIQVESSSAVHTNKLYLCEEFKQMDHQYKLHNSGNSLVNIDNNWLLECCCFCQNKFHFFSETQTIFKCTGCSSDCERYVCSKCYSFGVAMCVNGKKYKNAKTETAIFKCIKYFCKWNCNEKYFSWDLQQHEFSCAFQKEHLCPLENCEWTGKLSEMSKHVQASHGDTIFYKKHSFSFNYIIPKKKYSRMVVPVLGYFVNLSWKRENNNKYQFYLSMKESDLNKVPCAAVNVNGKLKIYRESFSLDMHNYHSFVLLKLNDI